MPQANKHNASVSSSANSKGRFYRFEAGCSPFKESEQLEKTLNDPDAHNYFIFLHKDLFVHNPTKWSDLNRTLAQPVESRQKAIDMLCFFSQKIGGGYTWLDPEHEPYPRALAFAGPVPSSDALTNPDTPYCGYMFVFCNQDRQPDHPSG